MKKYSDLFQIGEVAELYKISRKMILNYENHSLITPTEVDKFSGYRYFDYFAVARIGLILSLRRAGMSIPDIKGYFQGKISIETQINRLLEQEKQIRAAIEQLKIRNIKPGTVSKVTQIVLPEQNCICRETVAKDTDSAIKEFLLLYEDCIKRGYCFSGGDFSFCEFKTDLLSDNFFETENIKMRMCIGVDVALDRNLTVFRATDALAVTYCGEYGQSIAAYTALREYAKKSRVKIVGYPREYYVEGNFHNRGDNNLIRIVVPIDKT